MKKLPNNLLIRLIDIPAANSVYDGVAKLLREVTGHYLSGFDRGNQFVITTFDGEWLLIEDILWGRKK